MSRMPSSDTAFGLAAAFLFGIVAASLGWNPLWYILAPSIILIAVCSFFSYKPNAKPGFWKLTWKLSAAFAASIFLGAFYYNLRLVISERQENILFDKNISFSGVIVNEPAIFEKYQSFLVDLKPPLSGEVKILTSPGEFFDYGDLIKAEGKIEPTDSPQESPVSFFPTVEVIDKSQGFWLKEKLINFKQFLTGQFQNTLPQEEAALLSGITFGARSDFSKEFKNQMALSGTTHLVALSGYNISILVIAAGFIFGYFFSRKTSFYLTIAAIFLFVIMVGAEASIVRAAIMGFLVLLARESSRIYNMRNSITLAALVMALADPKVLVYNIGFQLSFLSLLGIVYIEPVLVRIFKLNRESAGGITQAALTTASAQIAVFPMLAFAFGQFSPVAILANTLILGFIPLTMAFGFLLAGLNAISVYLGFVLAELTRILLSYEIFVIKFFARYAWPISLGGSLWIVYAYYAVLIFAVHRFYEKTR